LWMIGMSRRIEYDIRYDFFRHLSTQSPEFYQRHPTGDLMALATNDLNAVRNVLGPGIMHGMNTMVTLVGTLSLMLVLSPRLTLVAMIPMPLVSVVMGRFGSLIHDRFEAVQRRFGEITARAQEYLAGIRVVKAYRQEQNAMADFDRMNREFVGENMRLVRIWGFFYPFMSFLSGAAAAIVLYVGGRQVMAGQLTLGEFVAFNTYLVMLIWPMMALGWVVNLLQRGEASMGRLNAVLSEPPLIVDGPNPIGGPIERGEIVFENVSFSYPGRPDQEALAGISLVIPAGSTLAIVGATGSGKSSLVRPFSSPTRWRPTSRWVSRTPPTVRSGKWRRPCGFPSISTSFPAATRRWSANAASPSRAGRNSGRPSPGPSSAGRGS
ncbi:MAG: ATP-binding cassette, subfamily B, bacterial, partial [bacterium]